MLKIEVVKEVPPIKGRGRKRKYDGMLQEFAVGSENLVELHFEGDPKILAATLRNSIKRLRIPITLKLRMGSIFLDKERKGD